LKWTLPRFSLLLLLALAAWLWPSVVGGRVLLPLDIVRQHPPFTPAGLGPIHNELIGDMVFENLAWKQFQRECVRRRELPLWNPYSFCGHPLAATGQASTFYPPNLIFLVMPLPQAYVVFTLVHLAAGGIFTWLFFRRIGVSGFGASVGGLVFAMCTFFAVRFIWPMLLGSAVWLPLMLLWIDWIAWPRPAPAPTPASPGGTPPGPAVRRFDALRGLGSGAVLFAMPILSGFFEIAFYAFFACGLYTVVVAARIARGEAGSPGAWPGRIQRAGGFLARVGGTTFLAVVLSLPQLLPFFEVMKRNVRSGEQTLASARELRLTGAEAITFAVPDALGNPAVHERFDLARRLWVPIRSKSGQDFHYFGPKNYVESTNYLGLLPLAFIALSPFARGTRRLYFWLLAGLSLGMAFVTPVYALFFKLVPGADQVRTPFRWTLLAMFAGCYLAAIGADAWRERLALPVRRAGAALAAGPVLLFLLLTAAVAAGFHSPQQLDPAAAAILRADPRAAGTFTDAGELGGLLWMNTARLAVFGLAASLLVGLAAWRKWGRAATGILPPVALLLVAADLGQATFRFNTHSDPALLRHDVPIVRHMREDAADEIFRVGRFGWQKIWPPNLPTLDGLQDYGGYDSIILTDFARYLQAIEPQKLLMYNIVSSFEQKASLDSPLFKLLNIRYLLSVKPLNHPGYETVDVPGNLVLSRARPGQECPRAFMVHQVRRVPDLAEALRLLGGGGFDIRRTATVQVAPDEPDRIGELAGAPGQARIREYRSSRVTVETSAAGRQLLVLTDMNYPGWRVYVDARPADIIMTDGIFRGVAVPAGEHTVDFRFEPAGMRAGGALSLACLIALAVAGVMRARSPRLAGSAPPNGTSLIA
jgi:hypothetical protein